MASTFDDNLFESLSKSDWKNLVEKELKGKSFDDFLINKNFASPEIEAYQNVENYQALELDPSIVQSAVKYFAKENTLKAYRVFVENEEEANQQALTVLAQGINAIHFQSHKVDLNWRKLIKDIDCSLIEIGFCSLAHEMVKNLNAFNPVAGSNILLEISPFNHSFNLPVLVQDLQIASEMAEKGGYNISIAIDFNGLAAAGADFAMQLAVIKKFYHDWISELRQKDFVKEGITKTVISHAFSPLFFGEIAKHRALACLLAEELQQENLISEKWQPGGFRIAFNQVFKGSLDPEVNLIRLSSFAFAAMACNPSSLMLFGYKDEAKNYVDRVSANVHNILIEESKLNHYLDPSAGSYFVEVLTQNIIGDAMAFYDKYSVGDWHHFIHSKGFTSALTKAAEDLRQLYNEGKLQMIGENLYPPAGGEYKSQLETLKLK